MPPLTAAAPPPPGTGQAPPGQHAQPAPGGRASRYLSREATIAPAGQNRWLIPPAALAIHLSIGQVYAFSVFKPYLEQRFGVHHSAIGWIFSIAILMLGLSAAFGGTWVEKVGPRKAMALSATLWVSGFLIGSLGVAVGQLWLLYLGYGVIGGMGLGIGYVSPVSTLIKWFPDRPGMATGLAIMGFGGGAAVAAPLSTWLLGVFSRSGPGGSGAAGSGPANASLLATAPPAQVAAAVVPTFLTLAAIYAVVMALGVVCIRIPAPGWRPAGWAPPAQSPALVSSRNVSASNAIRTPQFWLIWVMMFVSITAGISIVENAAVMIGNFFPPLLAVAAGYVGLNSLFNMGGRFGWSSLSDHIGRRTAYAIYLGAGAMAFVGLTLFGRTSPVVFVGLSALILSFYGGAFATLPAYLKDLFGGHQVSAIHGRVLTAWSAAGIAGPLLTNTLVDRQERLGVTGPAVYTIIFLALAALLLLGLAANLCVRPVASHWHEPVSGATVDAGLTEHLGAGSRTRSAAPLILWLLVGTGLFFGLWQTLVKAAALFR